MNIEVTRDNVTILEQSETPHENEYKITTCYFTFDEFTGSFQVKRAIFTILSTGEMYETDIINNQCDIPSEVLKHEYETVKLGVYGYNIGDNEELLNRFSPSYAEIVVPTGSYKEGALSPEPITPSQYDLYSQALQEGLQEVDDKLDEVVETVDGKIEEVDNKLIEVDTTVNNKMTEVDNKIGEVDDKLDEVDDKIAEVDTAITETNNLNLDVSDKVDGDVTVTLTKKDASTKSVVISDGTSLQFMWQGTSLGIKTDDMQDYIFVDLQGIQGVPGPQGEPFRIKKTYSSVAEMNADFNNMEYGDYVMIASTVEVEDNAKLYTRGESQWIFITDFSGATGIKGETGATPNIQIGTVTSGSVPNVTRTGTNENPVLNFVLQPGPQGQTGQTGATGNGIASITKTSTTGLVDTYTITFTDGNTTTFNVENGNGIDHISLTSQSGATKVYTIYFTDGNTTTFTVQDGEVTQEVFDEEVERLKMVYNAMPKVSGEGTDLTLDNTAECPVYEVGLSPSEISQETTTGKNLLNPSILENGNINTDTGLPSGTTGAFIRTNDYISVASSQTYAFQYGLKVSDVTGQIVVYEYDTNKNFIKFDVISGFSGTVTLSTTTEYIKLRLGAGTSQMEAFDYGQVEQNSSVTSYEPFTYGASPNPQYPQEIHTVSGENEVKIDNKNLFDESAISSNPNVIVNSQGFYEGTANNINSYFNNNFKNYNYKANTQYTISYNSYGSASNINARFIVHYTDNTTQTWNITSNTTPTNIIYRSTSDKTIDNISITYSNGGTIYIKDIMMVEGNYISSTMPPYIPHQEQTYPLSLGDLEYCKIGDYEDEFRRSIGKNLFDKNTATTTGYLEETGNIYTSGTDWRISDYINIQPNTTYTTSGMNTPGISPSRCYYDENKNFISGIKHNNTNPFINTSPSNAYFMRESVYNTNLDTIQVEKGNTATEWEPPYGKQWYLKKNIGKVVLDGSEEWTSGSLSTNELFLRFRCSSIDNKSVASVSYYTDKFSYKGNLSSLNATEMGIYNSGSAPRFYLWIDKNLVNGATSDDIKNWLSTNNVLVYYVLATPTYTLLSDTLQTQLDNIQKAITYQGQTNVSQTNNDLPFVIKLSAIRDLSGIFELIQ